MSFSDRVILGAEGMLLFSSACDMMASINSKLGQELSRTTISTLPNELLIEIFDWCRLHDEYGWNYRRQWYNPLQVCRKWRYIMLESKSRLGLRFLCNPTNPITTIPSHLTPIPLVLSFDRRYNHREPPVSQKELLPALRDRDRVCAISVSHRCPEALKLCSALKGAFPMLETLSLCGVRKVRVLPDNFVAPRIRALHLRRIVITRRSLLLANATNLSSLCLDLIPESGYLPPEYLVEHLAGMLCLENLSLTSPAFPPFPERVRELPHSQITRVVLPRLSRLIYVGTNLYLENLLSRISTPFLQDFRFDASDNETPDIPRLSAFLLTIQNLNLRAIVVSFYPNFAIIQYHPKWPSAAPPYLGFFIKYSQDHAVTRVAQICSAVVPALFSVLESLEIEFRCFIHSEFFAQRDHWHAFLRLFGGVKTLKVGMNFAAVLSDVLDSNHGGVIEELLPVLSDIVVFNMPEVEMVHQPFSSFIRTRRLSGHCIGLQAFRVRNFSLGPPPISWSFDTFDHVAF
jgi:hypothetical protein